MRARKGQQTYLRYRSCGRWVVRKGITPLGGATSTRPARGRRGGHRFVPYADDMTDSAWWRYVVTVTGAATQKAIAAATGIDQSSISRWQRDKHTPRAEAAVAFARAYNRSPVEALIAAGYLTSEDLGVVELTTLTGDLTQVSSDSLLSELRRRLLAAQPSAPAWPRGWSTDDPAVRGSQDREDRGDLDG